MRSLLTMRATLILLCAALAGLVAGGLMYWQSRSVPRSLAAGLGVAGMAVPVLDQLVE